MPRDIKFRGWDKRYGQMFELNGRINRFDFYVDNPSLAFAKAASLFVEDSTVSFKGVHKTAIIAKDVRFGKNVCVGPFVVIEGKVNIGDNAVICAGTYIGSSATIGKNCFIYPNYL